MDKARLTCVSVSQSSFLIVEDLIRYLSIMIMSQWLCLLSFRVSTKICDFDTMVLAAEWKLTYFYVPSKVQGP